MGEWLANLAGEGYATALVWTLAALILLLVLLVAARIIRNLRSGTFIAGGRNRAPRLAVVDATAVDGQRRLVLVRRDDVEHLILIGGPSDLVVEQQIRARNLQPEEPQQRPRPEPAAVSKPPPQAPAAPQPPQPKPAPPRPVPPPAAAVAEPERPRPTERPPAPEQTRQPAPASGYWRRPAQEESSASPAAQGEEPTPPAAAAASWNMPQRDQQSSRERDPSRAGDEEVVEELLVVEEFDISVDERRDAGPAEETARRENLSIEDEMSRLLDDLAEGREKKG